MRGRFELHLFWLPLIHSKPCPNIGTCPPYRLPLTPILRISASICTQLVMLILGFGLGLKAKFCGLGLGLAVSWPWPWLWPWPKNQGHQLSLVIDYIYYVRISKWCGLRDLPIRPHRAKMSGTARITNLPQMQCRKLGRKTLSASNNV